MIAHAKADNGIVVTHESNLHPMAKKPLVPNICREFDVHYVNTLGMFEELSVTF